MRFLSPEWLTAMHDAAAADPLPPGSSPIVVQHIIGDDGEGPTSSDPVTYAVVLAAPGAGTGVHPGRHPHPSLTFTSSYATARAIASGTSSAQAEFIAGRLRVGGDVRLLLDRRADLASGTDAFAAVRARTDFAADEPAADPTP